MLSNRYLQRYRIPERVRPAGCPVTLEAAVLLDDTKIKRQVAQLKFRAEDTRAVTGVAVSITAYNEQNISCGTVLFEYQNLNAQQGQYFGTYTADSCDYPDFALLAAEAVASGECDRGIVVCSSGIGVSIVANKVPGVRCAHCHDTYCAKYTRLHNDANMLAMGEKVVGVGLMEEIVSLFLNTEYEGGERHDRRINKIKQIEEKYYGKA